MRLCYSSERIDMPRIPPKVTLAIEAAKSVLGQITEPRDYSRIWEHFDWEFESNPESEKLWYVQLTIKVDGIDDNVAIVVGGSDSGGPDDAILTCCVASGESDDWMFELLVIDGRIISTPENIYTDADSARFIARRDEILRHERFGEFEAAHPNMAAVLREVRFVKFGEMLIGPNSIIDAAITEFDEFLGKPS